MQRRQGRWQRLTEGYLGNEGAGQQREREGGGPSRTAGMVVGEKEGMAGTETVSEREER